MSIEYHPTIHKLRLELIQAQTGKSAEEAKAEIDKQDSDGSRDFLDLAFDPAEGSNMNNDRAEWAAKSVLTFMQETNTDADSAIGDLLGNLRHLCDRLGLDFEEQLAAGNNYYTDETAGDQDSESPPKPT